MQLSTKAAGFRQAPLAAARPGTIVHHRGINGLAHHRFRLDADVKSSKINYRRGRGVSAIMNDFIE